MLDPNLTHSLTPAQLSRLLLLDEEVTWNRRDAAVALRQQLSSPVLEDMELIPEIRHNVQRLKKTLESCHLSQKETFLSQLTSPHPILEILTAIKFFAKQVRNDKVNPLREGPGTVLYFAAIAAARIGCDASISNSSDSEISEGCRWAMIQEGAEDLRAIFEAAINRLSRNSKSN